MSKQIFITGGTGYLGTRLIRLLLKKGYAVKALVREGSAYKLPAGCDHIIGDPFNANDFSHAIEPGSTFVQLLGVSHPSPKKKDLFYKIDYASVLASSSAALQSRCGYFVYVSVAQTATSIMKDYQQCRAKCEALIKQTNIPTTILRPWYIIGPGHYWPLFLYPLLKLMEYIPSTSAKARALRFVFLKTMLAKLVESIEYKPQQQVRIIEIAEINKKSAGKLHHGKE